MSTDGTCVACPTGCAECTTDLRCLTCKLGKFVLPGNPDTCIACDQPGEYRYYQGNLDSCDPVDRVCSKCATNCEICYDHERCSRCAITHLVDRTLALPTEKCITLASCALGKHFQESGACFICDDNCSECESRNTCKVCNNNYFLNQNKKCTACTGNCVKCESASSCLECSANDVYFVFNSDKTFKQCSSSCSPGNALVAQSTFRYDCYICPTDCSACSFDAQNNIVCSTCTNSKVLRLGRCVSCEPGYVFSAGDCVACTNSCNSICPPGKYGVNCDSSCGANCKTCNSDICITCLDGYFKYSPACDDCSRCNQPGDYLNPITGLCTANCVGRCNVCASATRCAVCEKGYYVNSVDESCIKCNEPGQFLDPNGVKCYNPCAANCEICEKATKCQQCKEGYFKDAAGLCTKCLPGCLLCDDQYSCKKCECQLFLLQPKNTKCIDIRTGAGGAFVVPDTYYIIGLPGKINYIKKIFLIF